MTPLPFVWPYALLFWLASFWVFWPEFRIVRRAERSASAKEAKSLQVILLSQGIALVGAWPLAWVHALQFPGDRAGMFLVGVAVLVAGSLLRRHCRRLLGSSAGLLAVATFVGYNYRMRVEEGALLAAIGEPYRRFMRTRKRLIAFFY